MKYHTKRAVLIFSIMLFVVLAGCDLLEKEAMDYYEDVKSTDLSSEHIDTVSIHSDETKLIDVFGKPFQVEELTTSGVKNINYREIEFVVSDGNVFRYYFAKDYGTAKERDD